MTWCFYIFHLFIEITNVVVPDLKIFLGILVSAAYAAATPNGNNTFLANCNPNFKSGPAELLKAPKNHFSWLF